MVPVGLFGFAKKIIFVFFVIRLNIFLQLILSPSVLAVKTLAPEILATIG